MLPGQCLGVVLHRGINFTHPGEVALWRVIIFKQHNLGIRLRVSQFVGAGGDGGAGRRELGPRSGTRASEEPRQPHVQETVAVE